MVGVPTGRGCVACRTKKKKCDERQPACGRCVRLMITCVGSGMKRFKFKSENFEVVQGRVQTAGFAASSSSSSSAAALAAITTPAPRSALVSEAARIGGGLVSILETQDVRYDIFTYGPFLDQLPRRLGSSPAIDAAVKAMVASFNAIKGKKSQKKAIAYYGHAISTLRKSLRDPKEACSANTMCAIYLAQVCKEWMGGGDTISPRHGGMLMHLLRKAADQDRLHEFDPDLLEYLISTIVTESFWNHDIQLDEQFLNIVNQASGPRPLNTGSIATVLPELLVELSIYIREPGKYIHQLRSTYTLMQTEHITLRSAVLKWQEEAAEAEAPLNTKQIAVRYNFMYGLFMVQALIVNRILRMYDDDPGLLAEAYDLCDRVIVQAREAANSRPFGAFFAPKTLMSAWSTISDPARLWEIEALLADYQTDFEEGLDYLKNAKRIKYVFGILESSLASGRSADVQIPEEEIGWDRDSIEGVSECIVLKPFGKYLLQGDALAIRTRWGSSPSSSSSSSD